MPYGVLFLCTGNSARSMLAECALGRFGGERFRSYSAGSHPSGAPHPRTLELLRELDYDVSGLRSKSWDEFAAPGAPDLDFVITVCDSARDETCPVWPGGPIAAHWGVADPAAARGRDDEVRAAFRHAYEILAGRVEALARLPLETLDTAQAHAQLSAIGSR